MGREKIRRAGNILGIIALFFGLVIAIILYMNLSKFNVVTLLSFENPYLCKKSGSEFIRVDNFTPDDNAYVCGNFKSNVADLKTQLRVVIYSEKVRPMKEAIYYDLIWVSLDTEAISINNFYEQGTYVVEVLNGREEIFTMQFEIIGNSQ